PDAWLKSPERTSITAELADIQRTAPTIYTSDENGPAREFSTSIWYQTWEVYKRLNLIWWRDPYYTYGLLCQSIICGLALAFTFYKIKDSSSDLDQLMFLLLELLFMGILYVYLVLPQFLIQKEYFKRDYASKFYSWFPFAICIVLVEIPYAIGFGSLCFIMLYWTCGFDYRLDSVESVYFWLIFVVFVLFMCTFGHVVASVCLTAFLSFTVLPVMVGILFSFSGVMVPYERMPVFWRSWIYKLNPAQYLLEGVITNALRDLTVQCSPQDFLQFPPPSGLTCEQYAYDFQSDANNLGYISTLDNGNCGYCKYKTGKEYYETVLSWSDDNRWRNLGVLISFWVFNIFMVILFIYLTRKAQR
ncbi:hypothetical protein CYY_010343, partial [Polysphondylium violaceum]